MTSLPLDQTAEARLPLPQHIASAYSPARSLGLVACAVALGAIALLSLRIGSIDVTTRDAVDALFAYSSSSYEQTVVRTLRLPRTLIGLCVGAALAVAGAVMQAATRNPLASPSILGVSSGAAFAIVTAVFFARLTAPLQYVWFAFAGAFGAAVLVFFAGALGTGGPSPVKLALAGAVVSALLGAWTTALLLLSQQTLDVVRFWLAGSLAGRNLTVLWTVLPFIAVGLTGALLFAHQLNILSLGDDTARALGMRTGRMRAVCAVLVVLLTGAAVAAAGPIAFVGLAVPHLVRGLVGTDYRWVLPYSALLGQGPIAPPGVLVEDLVAAGRYPYRRWFRQWDAAGEQAIDAAIRATGLDDMRLRPVETLSGGQRQRVWVAMALAQDTPSCCSTSRPHF